MRDDEEPEISISPPAVRIPEETLREVRFIAAVEIVPEVSSFPPLTALLTEIEEVPAFNVDSLLPRVRVVIEIAELVESFLIVLPFRIALFMLVFPFRESVFPFETVNLLIKFMSSWVEEVRLVFEVTETSPV